jgi:hypothetical protein
MGSRKDMKFELVSHRGLPSNRKIVEVIRERTEIFTKEHLKVTRPVVDNVIGEPVMQWIETKYEVPFRDIFHTIEIKTLEGLIRLQDEVGPIIITNDKNEYLGTDHKIKIFREDDDDEM